MQFTWFHVYLEGVYESLCLTPIEMSHFNANLVYEYWGKKIPYSMVKNLWVEVYCPLCNTFKVCILWHQSLFFLFYYNFVTINLYCMYFGVFIGSIWHSEFGPFLNFPEFTKWFVPKIVNRGKGYPPHPINLLHFRCLKSLGVSNHLGVPKKLQISLVWLWTNPEIKFTLSSELFLFHVKLAINWWMEI